LRIGNGICHLTRWERGWTTIERNSVFGQLSDTDFRPSQILLLPTPAGLSAEGHRALAAFVFTAGVLALEPVSLPILPNKTHGPYDVINPFHAWLMVVLIVGISVAGYAAYKLLGAKVGTLLSGVLGGIISSTATTVAYARQSKAWGFLDWR
jgi:hypothetical protein